MVQIYKDLDNFPSSNLRVVRIGLNEEKRNFRMDFVDYDGEPRGYLTVNRFDHLTAKISNCPLPEEERSNIRNVKNLSQLKVWTPRERVLAISGVTDEGAKFDCQVRGGTIAAAISGIEELLAA